MLTSSLTTALDVKLTVFTGSLELWVAQFFTAPVALQTGNGHHLWPQMAYISLALLLSPMGTIRPEFL